MTLPRACCRCGKAITACNGFTIARDQLALGEGELAVDQVRELCGMCSEALATIRSERGEAALDAAIRALPHPGERA